MILNVDADLVAFRAAASVGDEGLEEIAILRTHKTVEELLHSTGASHYNLFLTGRNNFRKVINTQYKANRTTPPPIHLAACREYLIKEWNACVVNGAEADDALGCSSNISDTICASIDKDLLMIPGWHYNWVKDEKSFTVPDEGIKHFYKQMLIGDKVDNIFGVVGLGKVKSARIIDPYEHEEEMIDSVFRLYEGDAERFVMNASCLWIMRQKGESWVHRVTRKGYALPNELKLEVDKMLLSMKSLMEGISMEPDTTEMMTSGMSVVGTVEEVIPETVEAISI